ncbi:hypothetical protein KM043_011076 [Ampulex compressa]|nr:hypothetical protein KM043_011076 [Ampulex compressa]
MSGRDRAYARHRLIITGYINHSRVTSTKPLYGLSQLHVAASTVYSLDSPGRLNDDKHQPLLCQPGRPSGRLEQKGREEAKASARKLSVNDARVIVMTFGSIIILLSYVKSAVKLVEDSATIHSSYGKVPKPGPEFESTIFTEVQVAIIPKKGREKGRAPGDCCWEKFCNNAQWLPNEFGALLTV